jgi:hypothetical protein
MWIVPILKKQHHNSPNLASMSIFLFLFKLRSINMAIRSIKMVDFKFFPRQEIRLQAADEVQTQLSAKMQFCLIVDSGPNLPPIPVKPATCSG